MLQKEALARISINKLLEDAGWRFFPTEKGIANIQLEPNVKIKQEYLDNYVFNAIVNHANYYYKSKKKNHINEDKIIEEIILNDYLKNKKKSRFNILKNYLSNSNPKSKFKNRYQVENAIRKINDEMEDAQKEFSKLFQNNEKDYN